MRSSRKEKKRLSLLEGLFFCVCVEQKCEIAVIKLYGE